MLFTNSCLLTAWNYLQIHTSIKVEATFCMHTQHWLYPIHQAVESCRWAISKLHFTTTLSLRKHSFVFVYLLQCYKWPWKVHDSATNHFPLPSSQMPLRFVCRHGKLWAKIIWQTATWVHNTLLFATLGLCTEVMCSHSRSAWASGFGWFAHFWRKRK